MGDGKRRLEDISSRFRNPFGNPSVIKEFAQKLQDELVEREEEIAQMEERMQGSKRVKTNPSPEQELNLAPSKANTIPSTSTPTTNESEPPKAKVYFNIINFYSHSKSQLDLI